MCGVGTWMRLFRARPRASRMAADHATNSVLWKGENDATGQVNDHPDHSFADPEGTKRGIRQRFRLDDRDG